MSHQIAYFINQYPKVSHSFIRREIMALERQGLRILRVSLRGWDELLKDADDIEEQRLTHYVLRGGLSPLAASLRKVILTSPVKFVAAFFLTIKMSLHAERPLWVHLIYLAEAAWLFLLMKKEGVEHVHAHFGTNPAEVVMLAHALGGPKFSFTVHGPEEFDRPRFLGLPEKISRSAFVAAVSSFGRSQIFRWMAHSQWGKVKVIRCGLDEGFYSVDAVSLPTHPRLVCVGRLCEQKGQLLLIEAARLLAENHIEFELVLAGDGELRAEIEQLISRYGLDGLVSITGWISTSEVREVLQSSRGLVLPSFAEGLPVVIMESLSLRRPVLTTYIAGIPELVSHQVNGWLFPAGSVDELYVAMRDYLALPSEVIERMGEAGRVRVIECHSADTEARKLASLFRESHL